MKVKIIPKRFFNNPTIMYHNFKDGYFINLIELKKAYSNGIKYAVYVVTDNPFISHSLFKTKQEATKQFNYIVENQTNYLNKLTQIKEKQNDI